MASKASSSAPVVNPLNPLNLPLIATIGKSLIVAEDTMKYNFGL
ncbi:hypothetical protein A2U01_0095917, partial [Trifolium medium]|nr:hypothetical protein [Trifolium medium]